MSPAEANLSFGDRAYRIRAAETSSNFFDTLGGRLALGRGFTAKEDLPGDNRVAIISYGLWQEHFAGEPRALGTQVQVNGNPYTIVGVADRGFDFPAKAVIWMPTVFDYSIPKSNVVVYKTIARLAPNLSFGAAITAFRADEARRNPGPKPSHPGFVHESAGLISLRDELGGKVGEASRALAWAVFFVLLTAAANVILILLARAKERASEFSLRAALGAQRARLAQQLVTESLALSALSALLGLGVAYAAAHLASAAAPAQLAAQAYTLLDARVFAFAAALVFVLGSFFGILPVFLLGRFSTGVGVVGARHSSRDTLTSRTRTLLLALQSALSLALLAAAYNSTSTFWSLLNADLGFEPNNVAVMTVSLEGSKSGKGPAVTNYYRAALDKLRQHPNVLAAGIVRQVPLGEDLFIGGTGKLDNGKDLGLVLYNSASQGYFAAIGQKMLAGRDFAPSARQEREPAIIVTEATARAAGLDHAIIGRQLTMMWSDRPYRIVGLVADSAIGSESRATIPPQAFFMHDEEPSPRLTFVARVRGDAAQSLPSLRDSLRPLEPGAPLFQIKTLNELRSERLAHPRFFTAATAFLALFAALLAVAGVFGSASYLVTRRAHEMGIRLALGATRANVRVLILRQCLLPVAAGLLLGVFLARAGTSALRSLLEQAPSIDNFACSLAASALLVCTALAAWLATSRLTEIDPSRELRAD